MTQFQGAILSNRLKKVGKHCSRHYRISLLIGFYVLALFLSDFRYLSRAAD